MSEGGDNAAEAERKGLRAAADSFAKTMREVSAVRTRQTADAVNVQEGSEEFLIRGGTPGGGWGWEPIQALMFDNNLRHPLFGNRKHWYAQGKNKGEWRITEMTEQRGIDAAADAFASVFIPEFARGYGFD